MGWILFGAHHRRRHRRTVRECVHMCRTFDRCRYNIGTQAAAGEHTRSRHQNQFQFSIKFYCFRHSHRNLVWCYTRLDYWFLWYFCWPRLPPDSSCHRIIMCCIGAARRSMLAACSSAIYSLPWIRYSEQKLADCHASLSVSLPISFRFLPFLFLQFSIANEDATTTHLNHRWVVVWHRCHFPYWMIKWKQKSKRWHHFFIHSLSSHSFTRFVSLLRFWLRCFICFVSLITYLLRENVDAAAGKRFTTLYCMSKKHKKSKSTTSVMKKTRESERKKRRSNTSPYL